MAKLAVDRPGPTDGGPLAAEIRAGFASGDTLRALAALSEMARRWGMSRLAKEMGVSRGSLHSSLSPRGNPQFSTVLKAMRCMGLNVAVAVRMLPANAAAKTVDRGFEGDASDQMRRRSPSRIRRARMAECLMAFDRANTVLEGAIQGPCGDSVVCRIALKSASVIVPESSNRW